MKLWHKVALVVAAVSVASLLLTGVVAIRVAGDAATQTAVRAKERDASAVAASVDRWVRDRRSTLLGWALAFPLAELDDERRQGLTRVVLGAIPSTIVVTLVDADGLPVVEPAYFEPMEAPDGAIAADARRVQRLLDALPLTAALASDDGTAVGEPFFEGGRPSVPIAVVAATDPPLVLGAELSLDIVAELEDQTSPDHAVVLLDAHGHALSGAGHPLLQADFFRSLLGNLASVSYSLDGLDVQGAVSPVPALGWSAVILEPSSVALEGPRRIRRLLPVVVGAAMLLATLLGLVLGRTITEPIARLRASALAVAEGRLTITTDEGGGEEVRALARAFNHMTERLRANQEEIEHQREAIESFNRELQQRVEAATRELREAQQQLVRSGQLAAVAQISAGLAHELNNPLTAVIGLAQLLKVQGVPVPLRDDLDALESEALRCREVVDTLLKVADGAPGESSRVPLTPFLQGVERSVAPAVARRGLELVVQMGGDHVLATRPGPATAALSQLVTGLAAGMEAGNRLTVEAVEDGPDLVVQIIPSSPVALESDDWMASGIDVWVARQTLDRLGAALVEPIEQEAPWQVRFRKA